MRKLVRTLLRLLIFAIVIIAGIVAINAIRYSSKQIPVELIPAIEVESAVADRLSKAIQFPTISYETHIDSLAFRLLDTFIQKNYVLVDSFLEKKMISGFSPVFKWEGKKPKLKPILLIGHLDVVPVDEKSLEDWEVPPFDGVVQDGFIWGRGSMDDKLSVFGLLEAVNMLLKADYVPERTLYLAFGHDEEVRGQNGALQIAGYFKEQNIQFEYVLDEGSVALIKGLDGLEKPLALIGVAEKGYATLDLTARLEKGGHSSMPPKETAVGVLSSAIVNLQKNPFPARIDGATKGLFKHVGPEMTSMYKTLFSNLWLTGGLLKNQLSNDHAANAMIRTTTAPTMLGAGVKDNVLPTMASAKVNFRILPGDDVGFVKRYVEKLINDKRVTVSFVNPEFSTNPSPVSSTDAFGFEIIQRSIQEIFPDIVVAPSLVIAQTDSRHYAKVSDHIYRFLPILINKEDLSRLHGTNERISIENYKRLIRFYHQLILNSCR